MLDWVALSMGGEIVYGDLLPSTGGAIGIIIIGALALLILYLAAYGSLKMDDRHPLLGASGAPEYDDVREREEPIDPDPSGVRACPNCGADNAGSPAFDYCRRCAEPLS